MQGAGASLGARSRPAMHDDQSPEHLTRRRFLAWSAASAAAAVLAACDFTDSSPAPSSGNATPAATATAVPDATPGATASPVAAPTVLPSPSAAVTGTRTLYRDG